LNIRPFAIILEVPLGLRWSLGNMPHTTEHYALLLPVQKTKASSYFKVKLTFSNCSAHEDTAESVAPEARPPQDLHTCFGKVYTFQMFPYLKNLFQNFFQNFRRL